MELLSFVGLVSVVFAIGWGLHWIYTNVKFKNPIKSYIRKEVLNYLQELQNDTM